MCKVDVGFFGLYFGQCFFTVVSSLLRDFSVRCHNHHLFSSVMRNIHGIVLNLNILSLWRFLISHLKAVLTFTVQHNPN